MLGRPAITPCPHPRTTKNSLSRHINHFSPRIEVKPGRPTFTAPDSLSVNTWPDSTPCAASAASCASRS